MGEIESNYSSRVMKKGRWRCFLSHGNYMRDLEVQLLRDHEDGTTDIVSNIEIRKVAENESAAPFAMPFTDGEEFLRAVMNAAWEYGIRPDGYQDVRETLAATKAHLEDMRKLAFDASGIIHRKVAEGMPPRAPLGENVDMLREARRTQNPLKDMSS